MLESFLLNFALLIVTLLGGFVILFCLVFGFLSLVLSEGFHKFYGAILFLIGLGLMALALTFIQNMK